MGKAAIPLLLIVSSVLGLVWQPSPAFLASQPPPTAGAPSQAEPPPKVGSAAWQVTANGGVGDIIVTANGYPDLTPAQSLPGKGAKTRFVFETLTRYADWAQAGLRRDLALRHVPHRVLWISNSLAIPSADRSTVQWLAAREDVARIDLDVKARGIDAEAPIALTRLWRPTLATPQSVAWGVAQVHAPDVWALGYKGQGIVIADLDTGVQWDHPALQPHYRGWNGVSAAHAYNWYDPTAESPNSPTDDYGHGTHTMGTLIGDDGGANQIGVAPGAQWIACRNMLHGFGSVSRYTACFQFALAPTDLAGNNPDPAKSADITSNSWSCWGELPYSEAGCLLPAALLTVTTALRAAGVMVIAAAGNEGPFCLTVGHAPGTYDQALSVGATDIGNNIATFSSRGPSTFTRHVKPDVVAPGVSVYSSLQFNTYGLDSGTSMATPHVAGTVALLWSASPGLRGNIDETEAILRRTAQPITSAETCGLAPGTSVPNNTYGSGLVNALAALSELRAVLVASAAPSLLLYTDVFTEMLVVTNTSDLTRTNVVVTASLPMSASLVSISGGGVVAEQTISWTIGDLPPLAAISETLALTLDHSGLIVNQSAVNYDGLATRRSMDGPESTTLAYGWRLRLFPVLR